MTEFEMPETQYAQSGDLSIAYQVLGDGPMDVVFVSGFISHQELAWELPLTLPTRNIASYARLITFDKRGTGLSERSLGYGEAEDRMDDIRAVMDAVGSERAAIIGLSEGGPLAILFAATYPERASALVLWDTYARGHRSDDYPIGLDPLLTKQFIEHIAEVWGSGYAMQGFLGAAIEDEETRRDVARYERNAATPRMAAEVLTRNVEIDVRSALPAVSAPTLVIHRSGDPVLPLRLGKYVADHIPGARFVELPGDFHVSGEPGGDDDVMDLIEEFLTGHRAERPIDIDRVLATVLFVDIVESTQRLAEVGDRKWRELLDTFRSAERRELERFRGREVNTRGDDILATFDGPARAISCAHAIAAAARTLGVEVRAGLHTGEVELQGDDIAGIAVHIGARVAALAGPGEVLVTSTVRDLVAGSGIEFSERGRYELKGVPGEWIILEASK
jgi:pimeloyl-ACP methyl ester carboxylesterase/class 3 adenylate cyclase